MIEKEVFLISNFDIILQNITKKVFVNDEEVSNIFIYIKHVI